MVLITALLSALTKRIGQLLQAVFGWSITALFGRLPAAKQTAVSIALVLSLAWPMLVVGAAFPAFASWALAFAPLQHWISPVVLRIVWLGLALLVPLGVGAIVSWVAPDEKQKGSHLRTLLNGYPLALGFALSFLVTLVVVPVLKLGAMAKRWNDEHVFVQVREGCYADVLAAVEHAVKLAGITTVREPVPGPMMAATRVMKFFARGGLDPIVADEPMRLRTDDLEVYLYPADLLLRGAPSRVAHVRAALLRQLTSAPAHLVANANGQKIEDELDRLWAIAAHREAGHAGPGASVRLAEIARKLDKTDMPYDDWVRLYTNLHRLERALCGGPNGVDPDLADERERCASGEAPERVPYATRAVRAGTSTRELVEEALVEGRDLVRNELALVRSEALDQLKRFRTSLIAFVVAVVCGWIGFVLLLVTFAIAVAPHPGAPLVASIACIVGTGVVAMLAIRAFPTKPLARTRRRVREDVRAVEDAVG